MVNGREERQPKVTVRWRRPPDSSPHDVARTAVAVVEAVLGQPQLDGRRRACIAPIASDREAWRTAQTAAPLSFTSAPDRLVRVFPSFEQAGEWEIALASGTRVPTKTSRRRRRGARVAGVDDLSTIGPKSPRVMRRPGSGGRQRRTVSNTRAELAAAYGEIEWTHLAHGAILGVLTLADTGNAVGCARLSGEDRNDGFPAQIEPILALARSNAEKLSLARLIIAEDISGTWEVRHDRAGPPPHGEPERYDMLLLDEWIREGWVEHVLFRDVRRMARKSLPAEVLIDRWERNKVGLWLADQGRQVDYQRGRALLSVLNAMAAEDRNNLTMGMRTASINKGPAAGLGWGSAPRAGFVRDRRTKELSEDPEQMALIHVMFELASRGLDGGAALSVRAIAREIAAAGWEINHSTIHDILRDPIYVTGEWTARIGEVEIEQTPVALTNPVPLVLWQRAQEYLDLREGSTKNTPIGEFLFNTVETVHVQCEGECDARDYPVRIRGYVDAHRATAPRTYHHKSITPATCKGQGRGRQGAFTWTRDLLEPSVVRAINEVVTDPELLRALTAAEGHDVAADQPKLSPAQRADLEAQIDGFETQRSLLVDALMATPTTSPDQISAMLAKITQINESIDRKVGPIKRRLSLDARIERAAPRPEPTPSPTGLVKAFLDIMTPTTPTDPKLKAIRARIFQTLVSRVEIDDTGGDQIQITIVGHIVPHGSHAVDLDPLPRAADLIALFADDGVATAPVGVESRRKPKRTPAGADAHVAGSHETVGSCGQKPTVWDDYAALLNGPRLEDLERERQRGLEYTGWRSGRGRKPSGHPAWRRTIKIDVPAE